MQMKRFISCCFKNVPLSVAIHHQQWMCYQLASHGQDMSNFHYGGDEVTSGEYIANSQLYIAHHDKGPEI